MTMRVIIVSRNGETLSQHRCLSPSAVGAAADELLTLPLDGKSQKQTYYNIFFPHCYRPYLSSSFARYLTAMLLAIATPSPCGMGLNAPCRTNNIDNFPQIIIFLFYLSNTDSKAAAGCHLQLEGTLAIDFFLSNSI